MSKTTNIIKQILRFGMAGIIVTILDFSLVYIGGRFTDIPILYVTFVSYLVALVVNYILTVKWVFRTDNNHKRNITVFLILAVCALGITQLVMWLGVEIFGLYFMYVKVISTLCVNIFNFIGKKTCLEVKE